MGPAVGDHEIDRGGQIARRPAGGIAGIDRLAGAAPVHLPRGSGRRQVEGCGNRGRNGGAGEAVIGRVELTDTADLLRAKTYLPIPSLVTSASIYLLLTTVMTQFSGAVERRFDIEDKLA